VAFLEEIEEAGQGEEERGGGGEGRGNRNKYLLLSDASVAQAGGCTERWEHQSQSKVQWKGRASGATQPHNARLGVEVVSPTLCILYSSPV